MNLKKPMRPKAGSILVKEYTIKNDNDGHNDGFNAEKTKSGLYAPTNAAENKLFKTAEVVAVGADSDEYTMECKVGDIVVVNKTLMEIADKNVRVNGIDHYWMTEQFGVFGWIE